MDASIGNPVDVVHRGNVIPGDPKIRVNVNQRIQQAPSLGIVPQIRREARKIDICELVKAPRVPMEHAKIRSGYLILPVQDSQPVFGVVRVVFECNAGMLVEAVARVDGIGNRQLIPVAEAQQ